MLTHRPHAVVIGSGFGGLAAAVRLGARGWRVTVLEQLDAPGGRAYVHRQDGYTFDAGPTVITAPFLFEELWALAGRRLADDVELRPVAPFYRLAFDDGTGFDYSGDAAAMRAEVARLAPEDVAGYERFLAASEAIYRVGFERLGHVPFDSWTDMARVLPELLRLESWRTVYALACKHVRDERLRVVLTFQSLLVGGNPFATTSVYCLIAWLERRHGVHYAMGGTGALVKGLVRLIEGQGGCVQCGRRVAQITVERGAATGVRLADGETIAADIVVSNADSASTYRHLLAPEHRRRWTDARLERARYSMSLFVWYFGTRGQYPGVAHHTILLGPRYRGLLDDIFEHRRLADDFSLYLHRPTATDPSMAPPGCDAFYVLSPVPHQQSGIDWRERAEPYRRRIQQHLEERLLPGLSGRIATQRVTTPLDFEQRLSSFRGAAFGLEPVLTQSAWFRPHNRSEDVARLYLVGAGTHPGAGLPGVLSSARILDRVIPAPTLPPVAAPQGGSRSGPAEPDPRTPWGCRARGGGLPLGSGSLASGPALPPATRRETPEADLAACRAALAHGSRTFLAASHLLPRAVRDPACALYAFCRMADDAVDGARASPRAVERLRVRLDAVYRDAPLARPSDRAFARVVQRYGLPRALPEALLEGFEWDLQRRRYAGLDALHAYAARVAGSVGAMMAVLMGARGADALARACDLGVAMQLSNIARDVGEDARMGRLYLPWHWLEEAGIEPDRWLAQPRATPALAAVVQRLLRSADALYERVGAGVAALPLACRPGINAARALYAAIGHQVELDGLDPVTRRAHVSAPRKLVLLAGALARPFPSAAGLALPPLDATRFLVEAAALPVSASAPRSALGPALGPAPGLAPHWWQLGQRGAATVDLFVRLEQRDWIVTHRAS